MADDIHFGIIDQFETNQHYDELSEAFPQVLLKYHCVDVPDDIVNEWVNDLSHVHTHWIRYGREAKGLAHCGITLIPPESLGDVLGVVQRYILPPCCGKRNRTKMKRLISLLNEAITQNKWVIHFGL
jgi:hypothetical protein